MKLELDGLILPEIGGQTSSHINKHKLKKYDIMTESTK